MVRMAQFISAAIIIGRIQVLISAAIIIGRIQVFISAAIIIGYKCLRKKYLGKKDSAVIAVFLVYRRLINSLELAEFIIWLI